MPRDKTVQTAPKDASELPELTPQRHKFIDALLQGMSASDAYRAAFDTSNWSPEAIWVQASRLKTDPKVSLWLDRIRQDQLANTIVTLEGHTRELLRLSQAAEKSGNYGAAAKCVELTGRANGLYVDQIKTDTGQADVLQALAAIGKVDPALAKQLGERLGLPDSDTGEPHNPGSKLTH